MKLIIDIPDEVFEEYKNWDENKVATVEQTLIAHGTPLPKGHGRLIDADDTLKAMNNWDKFGFEHTGCFVRNPEDDFIKYVHYEDMVKSVSGASTIVEADKENDNETDS